MVICELCGSANVETESECRVCGHALHAAVEPDQTPVPAAQQASPPSTFESAQPADIDIIPPHLQMSAFRDEVATGAPPMFGAAANQETIEPPIDERSEMPSFMQASHRGATAPVETVDLISANDLPDWIKQIAAADAAKAQAEADAHQAINVVEAPASLIRKQLPGETVVNGPATNWLSKTPGGPAVSEHWGSSEVASANWGNLEAPVSPVVESYPTAVPSTGFVPTVREQPKLAKTSRFTRPTLSADRSGSLPIYRKPAVQLIVALIILAVVALMVL